MSRKYTAIMREQTVCALGMRGGKIYLRNNDGIRMKSNGEFEASDFLNFNDRVMPGERDSLDCIADIANRLRREWLDKQPVVYGLKKKNNKENVNEWFFYSSKEPDFDTHRARLVDIEEIKDAQTNN